MQILAIRGENLASLAEPFAIDLTQAPLKNCGLFAITGETGAGKSTVLDAMCLALYGECPRLSLGGMNDDIPDTGGDTIKSRDARAILRRGAAEGFAEVDFLAPDGQSYRVRWSARRARGRADGRLQAVDRVLIRLADLAVMETQLARVNAQVVDLSGLTYDEFRRTVLLAQGDFDAFLRANTADRAALLEKVTGTARYREISKRVYERFEAAKSALATLETRRGEYSLLTAEDRAALDQTTVELTQRLGEIGQNLTGLRADLQRHTALDNATHLLAEVTTRLQQAVQDDADAQPQRTALATLQTALPLRPEYDRLSRAVATAKTAQSGLQTAVQAQSSACLAVVKADEDSAKATRAHDGKEAEFRAFGPIWTKATGLDSRIEDAANEVDKATKTAQTAEGLAESASRAATALRADLAQSQTALASATDAMSRHPQTPLLADHWDRIHSRIHDYADQGRQVRLATQTLKAARSEIADRQAELAQMTAQTHAERQKMAAIDAQATDATNALQAIETAAPQRQMDRIRDAQSVLETLLQNARSYEDATQRRAQSQSDLQTAGAELTAAQQAQSVAQTRISDGTITLAALQAPFDRANAAVSAAAAQMRVHLVAGQACPVCGATAHSVHSDQRLAEQAQELRRDLDRARQQVEQARDALALARSTAGRAELAQAQAQKGLLASQNQQNELLGRWQTEGARLAEHGIATAPLSQPDGAGAALAIVAAQLTKERAAASVALETAADLGRAISAHNQTLKSLAKRIEDRTSAREAALARVAELGRSEAQNAQLLQSSQGEMTRILTEIAPAFAAVGQDTAALDLDLTATIATLSQRVDQWASVQAQQKMAETQIAAATEKLAQAKANLDSAEASKSGAETALLERRSTLTTLQQQRAQLLGGEATDAHRTRHNEARLAAQRAKETATASQSKARADKDVADDRWSVAVTADKDAQLELQHARTVLEQLLARAGLSLTQLETLLPQGATEAARLTEELQALQRRRVVAEAAVQQRQHDLDQLRETAPPTVDAARLETAIADAQTAQSECSERIGAIASQIANDTALRAKLGTLETQISAAGDIVQTWLAVNEAVGARNGNKFAQIAQAVTLSMLVERANLHLADLKPRYRLVHGLEDLALHVVDQDMGDEIRSTRSLSGGERFLVSLSLALALSRMGRHGGLAATLFIDEGFGSLDAESLDLAIDALETLQAQGRTIGVISHVQAMKDRIPVQVQVLRHGNGRSTVAVTEGV